MTRPSGISYLIVIDADGADVPGSRRSSTGSRRRDLAMRAELEGAMGEGCSVIFRDGKA